MSLIDLGPIPDPAKVCLRLQTMPQGRTPRLLGPVPWSDLPFLLINSRRKGWPD
jgi:hypothetical protein